MVSASIDAHVQHCLGGSRDVALDGVEHHRRELGVHVGKHLRESRQALLPGGGVASVELGLKAFKVNVVVVGWVFVTEGYQGIGSALKGLPLLMRVSSTLGGIKVSRRKRWRGR